MGIAAWFSGNVKVVGVEPEAAPTLSMALKAGGPVDAPAGGIAADSLAPRRIGTLVYPIAKRHVGHVVLVPDEVINRAQLALWETLRVVAEPGGAAAFAALISGRYEPGTGEHVGILLSGGNTTAVNFADESLCKLSHHQFRMRAAASREISVYERLCGGYS
jgi:threonine dehydratase